MKKNALLGVFALLFAAGAAFATSTRVIQPVYYYLNESNQTGCTMWNVEIDCSPGTQNCFAEDTPDGPKNLYGDNCNVELQQDQGF